MARIQVQKGQNSKKKNNRKGISWLYMHIYTHFVKKTYKGFWYSVQRFKKICLQIIKKNKQTKTKTEDCIGQVYLLYRNISCRPVITL